MTFVLSNWKPRNATWLQHDACSETVDRETVFSTISNMKFYTSGAIAAPLDYNTYQFGRKCNPNTMDTSLCEDESENCHLSWIYGDELKAQSPEARCRTLPRQRAPEGYTYTNQCGQANAGICGDSCTDCYWSYPSDDQAKWASAEAMCRCKPAEVEYTFGGSCNQLYDEACGADCTDCRWSWPSD